ncbi:MAG: flagellar basal body L-ring protein FlgH [Deltaproteobacteria bacterium]|nr:flagellar basal body L-ring protein FlgH [Deltaproteobacteria bacterium]
MTEKRIFQIINVLVTFVFFLGLWGCNLNSPKNTAGLVVPDGVSTEPGLQPRFSLPRPSEGSLWINKTGSMFEDSKAAHVGDTVIVDIIENSTSSMNVNTESSRKTGMDIGLPTINLLGDKKIFGAPPGATKLLGTDFSNTFKGQAKSDRSGQVTASIAARVTEVLPNGNLSLFGRRAVKVNNEVQYITVAGVVRPQDISASNRVKSSYLADSRIEYYGKGALADKQKPGWGTRILDNIWPW